MASKEFVFTHGHVERGVEPVSRTASAKTKANQLHNEIQNKLYIYLRNQLGAIHVGTEIDTGSGTAIDLATKRDNEITFYEIKTSNSVRACIRQAIPQLLEYAYWPAAVRASKLVIVSHLPITRTGQQYLELLRKMFNLPIHYQQFSLKNGRLV